MARERSIVVRLRAEVSDFQRQMGAAGRSLTDFEKAQQRMGGAATTTMGRMAQSARANEQEWTTVGKSLLVAGGAMAGIGIAALKTGISYNTLQQTSRAALTTLLGGAAQANAQMDRLDEFARKSPFAKQVFIQAQQQMLGFGIATEKVIPYLDSVQNAVAAMGGSNQQISEISYIMSQISAASKITAVDLMQFGQRGINAAELIGSQMGMTGAEIREAITAGTLDAETALDALAAGMQEAYGGAAENVKNTFAGAIDRVKAAWRDFSGDLATPLVNPRGGGALVDWLNSLADAMRAFINLPEPVKWTAVALTGLATATALAGGAAMTAAPKLANYHAALVTLGNTHPLLARMAGSVTRFTASAAKVGAVGVAFAGLAYGAAKLYDQFADNRLPLGIEGTTEALLGLSNVSIGDQFTQGFDGIADAAERLLSGRFDDRINQWAGRIGTMLGIESNTWGNAATQFDQIGESLAELVNRGETDRAAQEFYDLYSQVDQSKISYEDFMALMPAYGAALSGVTAELVRTADGQYELVGGTDAAQEAFESWSKAVESMRGSFGGVMGAYQSVIDKNKELAESTAAASSSSEASWEDFYDGASVSMQDWIAAMEEQRSAAENVRDNVITAFDQIATDVPRMSHTAAQGFIEEMLNGGEEGAAALQAFVDGTPAQRQALLDAWAGTGAAWNEAVAAGMEPVEPEVDTEPANAQLQAWRMTMGLVAPEVPISVDDQKATLQMIAWRTMQAATSTSVPVDADTDDADETISNWQNTMIGDPPIIDVDADPALGTNTMDDWRNDQGNTLLDAPVDANTSPADGTFGKWLGRIEKDTATTNLDADDEPAQSTFAGWAGSATRARVVVPLRSDDKPARTVTNSFTSWAGNRNPKVDLGAQDRKGRATTNTFTRWAGGRSARVDLGAQDRKARNTTTGLTKWMNRRSGRVSVGANDSSARKTVNNLVASIGKRSTSITVNARKGSGPSVAGFAAGGAIRGPGSGTSDSILAALSNGEHVWTAREVKALGGHGAMAALRASVLSGTVRGFANGGAVTPTFQAPAVSVAPAVNVGGNEWAVYVQATPDSGYIRAQARVVVNGEIADQARSLGNVSVR